MSHISTRSNGIRIGFRSGLALVIASIIGIASFGWPLLAAPQSGAVAHASDAPWIFALLLPVTLAVVVALFGDGGLDARSVAMLGLFAAVATALRPLGSGVAGLDPIFVILVLGGRALGPAFGFALGLISLFTSALVTGGVGPWLPFQMLAAAWLAMGAGMLPDRLRGRTEVFALALYGALAAWAYGIMTNLSFWPWATGLPDSIAFAPGAPLSENLMHWWLFSLATSAGYDIPRAVLTGGLLLLIAKPALLAIRRATRRAGFGSVVEFVPIADSAP